jgi:hypothetical protein
MTIQNPIIAAGATVSRAEARTVLGLISDVVPPESQPTIENGQLVIQSQDPLREGQMVFVESSDGSYVTPYIVVTVATELVWKRVFSAGVTQDPRTGKPKDPLYDYA